MKSPQKIEIETADGMAPCFLHRPEQAGTYPGVIFYPDAGGVRDLTHEMAARIAALGYVVLLADIFYRSAPYAPFNMKTVFGDPAERDRLMVILRSLDAKSAMADAAYYIKALRGDAGVKPGRVACTGYCIGGRLALLTAGTHPEDIAAAAIIHGGGLATDAPDSPHLLAEKIQASLYLGIADHDGSFTPEQQGRLVTALAGAHVRFTLDHLKGVAHGYAMTDFPVYNPAAAEGHFVRVEELLRAAFGA